MNTDTRRHYGTVFQSISIDSAAAKCAHAAVVWGGLAMVFCDPDGSIEAVAPGTIDAEREVSRRPMDLVGTYDAPHQSERRREVSKLIARDIQHHLQLAPAVNDEPNCKARRGRDDIWTPEQAALAKSADAAQVAQALGKSVVAVRSYRQRHKLTFVRSFTPADDEAILTGRRLRRPFKEIAAKLGRTAGSVRSREKKLKRKGAEA